MFDKKIVEIIAKDETLKNEVFKELKKDVEVRLLVELVRQIINEEDDKINSICSIQEMSKNHSSKVDEFLKEELEKEIESLREENFRLISDVEELKEKGKKVVKEREELKEILQYKNEEIVLLNVDKDKLEENLNLKNTENLELREEFNKIENDLTKSNLIVNSYKEKYEKIEAIYNRFNGLSENTRSGLRGIFRNTENIDLFIFCCAESDKLNMFWDFIRNAIVNGNGQDITEMNEIFDYFFDSYSKVSNGLFERLSVEVGEDFDTDYHIRVGNKPSGEIQQVLLRGYKNKNTGKIVQKTVVSL